MSGGDDEQSQSGYEDTGAAGPGAPTPLSALEVRVIRQCSLHALTGDLRELEVSPRETSSLW